MYDKVVISQASENMARKPYFLDGTTLRLNLVLYTDLGSLLKNSELARVEPARSPFQEFIIDMEDYGPGGIPPSLESINFYLGRLGVEEIFPVDRFKSGTQEKVNARYTSPYKKDNT